MVTASLLVPYAAFLLSLPPCPASVNEFIQNPGEETQSFIPPSGARLRSVERMARALAQAHWGEAAAHARNAEYSFCRMEEGSLLALLPDQPRRGDARAFFNLNPSAPPVLLEAPHPVYDRGTALQGWALLRAEVARGLVVSGSNRCASPEATPCSRGTTSACGKAQAYRKADAAHHPFSTFHSLHVGFSEAYPTDWVVSLHGMKREGVSLSNGTLAPVLPQEPLAIVARSLLADGVSSVTACSEGTGAPVTIHLCGSGNMQGRHLNGSSNACTRRSPLPSHRFLHLEQSPTLRNEPEPIARALRALIASRASASDQLDRTPSQAFR
jgi:hypothetical protein